MPAEANCSNSGWGHLQRLTALPAPDRTGIARAKVHGECRICRLQEQGLSAPAESDGFAIQFHIVIVLIIGWL